MPQETVGYVELEWTCVHCGTKNEGTRQTCSGCGAPMSDSQKFQQAGQETLITDKDLLAKVEKGPDVHCPWCGTRNPAGAEKCSHCGGDLTGATVRSQGEILGAFKSEPQPDVKCSFCGTMNPAGAKKCSKCNSPLESAPAPTTVAKPVASKRIGFLPIAVIAVLVVACISFLVLNARTTATTGTVNAVSWQRSIDLLKPQPVQHENWRDQIPSGAQVGSCTQKVRRTQDQPAQNAQKVCGTPYTIDQGNGTGKVVQDCKYNIMDSYCQYTAVEWVRVDAVVAKGSDLHPVWPTVISDTSQRAGPTVETYKVTFIAGDKTYTYSPHSAEEYARFTPGSKWTLQINALGNVNSVQPAN
ncbi:MAG: hypothetical protein M1140_07900 [Chloroflexi bacterium]|nr:hypothetical protein [Chloroflexota bacterium]